MSKNQPDITIYTRTFCGYCTRAISVFEAKGLEVNEIQVDTQPGAREEMLERSNGGVTYPQIFVGRTHVGGCTDLLMLEARAKLDDLLEAEGA